VWDGSKRFKHQITRGTDAILTTFWPIVRTKDVWHIDTKLVHSIRQQLAHDAKAQHATVSVSHRFAYLPGSVILVTCEGLAPTVFFGVIREVQERSEAWKAR
jgi:hypothetical protein